MVKNNLEVLVKMKILSVDENKFLVNAGYKYKKLRVKIDVPIKSDQKAEVESTLKSVEEDRNMLMQAVIVRIMKTRKELSHNELIGESIAQMASRFQPNVSLIKVWVFMCEGFATYFLLQRCIDTLMEKEYLRRVEGTRDRYAYVA